MNRRILYLVICFTVTCTSPVVLSQTAAPEVRLSKSEFDELHRQLRPMTEEAWQKVPWKLSVLEARDEAARAKKPVFMLVRSGHPLGCV